MKIVNLPQRWALINRETCGHDFIAQTMGKFLPHCHYAAGENLADPKPICRYTKLYEHHVEIECGFYIKEKIEPPLGTRLIELPAGRAVFAEHVGPYENLVNTHNAINVMIHEQGLEIAGPPWEQYVSDPDETPIEDVITHVYCPVK